MYWNLFIFSLRYFVIRGCCSEQTSGNQNVFGKEKHKFANTGINNTRGHLGGGTIISNLN